MLPAQTAVARAKVEVEAVVVMIVMRTVEK